MRAAAKIVTALVMSAAAPGVASARTCQEDYYICLNNSYNTSGFERIFADLECATRYYGCMKGTLK